MPTTNPGGGLPHDSTSDYLADHTDQPWDERRSAVEDLRMIYEAHGLTEWASRMDRCAEFVHFARADNGLKPVGTHYCHVRTCPLCDWRRSMEWRAKLHALMPAIRDAYPKARWLFLTLTVRNCPVDELRSTLHQMSRAWNRLLLRPELKPVMGWIRTVEITRGKDNSAHPHFHVLLLVPSSYFGAYYVKQRRWTELWQECMALDYSPIVDVRAVSDAGIIPEVAKYTVKPSSLDRDADEWLATMARQIHNRHLVAAGGVLRQALRYLRDVRELEALENAETLEQKPDLTFRWRRKQRRYKRYDPDEDKDQKRTPQREGLSPGGG